MDDEENFIMAYVTFKITDTQRGEIENVLIHRYTSGKVNLDTIKYPLKCIDIGAL